jgi:hypothetical protein
MRIDCEIVLKVNPINYRFFLLLFIVLSSSYLGGCVYGVGKASLSNEPVFMNVTEDKNSVKKCELIKEVEHESNWGGMLLQDDAFEHVMNEMKKDSVEAGANVLLVTSKSKGFNGSSAKGVAYRCPYN